MRGRIRIRTIAGKARPEIPSRTRVFRPEADLGQPLVTSSRPELAENGRAQVCGSRAQNDGFLIALQCMAS